MKDAFGREAEPGPTPSPVSAPAAPVGRRHDLPRLARRVRIVAVVVLVVLVVSALWHEADRLMDNNSRFWGSRQAADASLLKDPMARYAPAGGEPIPQPPGPSRQWWLQAGTGGREFAAALSAARDAGWNVEPDPDGYWRASANKRHDRWPLRFWTTIYGIETERGKRLRMEIGLVSVADPAQ